MPKTVAGLLPVLHTPFLADGAIDYASLDRQMDFVYQHGADGVTIALASDLLRLTFAERLELGQEVAKRNRGRGSLILSVGAESIPQALTYARAAEAAGADALMAIPPLSAVFWRYCRSHQYSPDRAGCLGLCRSEHEHCFPGQPAG
jgi:dihydrodipicolinate synthase/N-acetylneuraminate lyase